MVRLLAVLVLVGASVNAQTITTQTFGNGTNQFSIDFVTIGNPGNSADTTGSPNPAGRVDYIYSLGKYEISRDMITKANASAGLGITMTDMSSLGGNGADRPANGISWFEAARFVNLLNTSTGSSAAYKFDINGSFQLWSPGDVGYDTNNPFRNLLANFWLPNVHEWYKAAYGSPAGTWTDFADGSNGPPTKITSGAHGAVYGQISGDGSETGPAAVDQAGSLSLWGTMGQGGNVAEWMENAFDRVNDSPDENREVRGGTWINFSNYLSAYYADNGIPGEPVPPERPGTATMGFRVAMVPEPSSLSLLFAGGAVFAAARRRRLD